VLRTTKKYSTCLATVKVNIFQTQGKKGNKKGERDEVGGGLLSQRVPPQLPSTLAGLTSGFEKGPGVPPPLLPPTTSSSLRFNEVSDVTD
jgi:hypothetical protein